MYWKEFDVPLKYHFISGLPRSGSTLLSALLRQNPRFTAGMSSPVSPMFNNMFKIMNGHELKIFFDEKRRISMLKNLLDSYYIETGPDKIAVDTNRNWTGKMALLAKLYPDSRIICCVRGLPWIIDSIERMLNKNPLYLSSILKPDRDNSVYKRADTLMNADNGLIGLPFNTLREAWFGDFAKRLIVIPYESLAKNPKGTMNLLYKELDEKPFAHDFDNVQYDEPAYDENLGMPGLHKVREKVEYKERKPGIPPDLFNKYAPAAFWSKPEMNPRGVTIIQP
jgi:sulfotransferase